MTAKVYDIYMSSNYGATGAKRHYTNHIQYYPKPIVPSAGKNYIDESSDYPDVYSIPTNSNLFRLRKKLETAVCVCMYNENINSLEATLNGIYKNIAHMPKLNHLNGSNKKIDISSNNLNSQQRQKQRHQMAVFVIQDGITLCDESIIKFLEPYEPNPNRSRLKSRRQIIAYETQAVQLRKRQINPNGSKDFPWSIPKKTSLLYQIEWHPKGVKQNHSGLQVFFVFKHINGKKLSSHAWFFEGFCRFLNPQYCILLDVGTVPNEKGIAKLVQALQQDQKLGGVSGFMSIDAELVSQGEVVNTQNQQNFFKKFFYSIQKAQTTEYIMAHFLDKNFESAMGFLHVLPGAWSGYRRQALQTGQIYERDILQKKYFRTLINPNEKFQAQQMMKIANMYLAEDRILSLAIYCQRNKNYFLKYIPDAKAKTDPMKNQVDLALQRRRWINSSLYAFFYVKANYQYDMANSLHNWWDKLRMHINILLSTLSFLNTSLIPCFFLFIFFSTIRYNGLIENSDIRWFLAVFLSIPYIIIIIISIGGSLNGNIWIRDPYQRNENGDIKVDEKSKKPVTIPNSKTNGNANILTICLTVYNYLWLIVVGVFTIALVVEGAKNQFNFEKMRIQASISILFLFVNIACNFLLLLVHLPTHGCEVFQLVVGSFSSLSYLSLYTHTMTIFSICNVDDVSWGTKGATNKQDGIGFTKEKSYFVGEWILKNTVICFIMFMIDNYIQGNYITIAIACYATFIYCFKCIIAIFNQSRFLFSKCCKCCY